MNKWTNDDTNGRQKIVIERVHSNGVWWDLEGEVIA
jgi:hypothetical protein